MPGVPAVTLVAETTIPGTMEPTTVLRTLAAIPGVLAMVVLVVAEMATPETRLVACMCTVYMLSSIE